MPWGPGSYGVYYGVKRNYNLLTLPALTIVILDQLSKFLVVSTIQLYETIPVINGFFNLVHIRNRGIAFGLMNRPGGNLIFTFLITSTIGAIVLLVLWFLRLKNENIWIILGFSLIIGGAVGNLIDRLRLREVIDFLDFYIGPYHWPAFNVADSAITVGAFWVAINMIFLHSSKDHVS